MRKTKKKIAELNFIPYLLKLLRESQDNEAKKNSTSCIGNLASANEDLRKQLLESGILKLVYELLSNAPQHIEQNNTIEYEFFAVKILSNLSASAFGFDASVDDGIVDILLAILKVHAGVSNIQSEALEALLQLSEHDEQGKN